MKKGWALVIVLMAVSGWSVAQSVADDTQQLLLDVEKLTELKEILSEMYQAYTVIHQGYESVKQLSQGTFSLHKLFLDGLLAVNPTVASYWKVEDIIDKEAALVKEAQSAGAYLRGTGQFTSDELGLFLTRYNNVIQGTLTNVSELIMVVTAGTLRMSDAERLAVVDRIDENVTLELGKNYAIDNDAAMLALQRAKEAQDISTLQSLYGIGP
jgi:hypothetical protein